MHHILRAEGLLGPGPATAISKEPTSGPWMHVQGRSRKSRAVNSNGKNLSSNIRGMIPIVDMTDDNVELNEKGNPVSPANAPMISMAISSKGSIREIVGLLGWINRELSTWALKAQKMLGL